MLKHFGPGFLILIGLAVGSIGLGCMLTLQTAIQRSDIQTVVMMLMTITIIACVLTYMTKLKMFKKMR